MIYNAVVFLPPETSIQILALAWRGNEFGFILIRSGFLSTLQKCCVAYLAVRNLPRAKAELERVF